METYAAQEIPRNIAPLNTIGNSVNSGISSLPPKLQIGKIE